VLKTLIEEDRAQIVEITDQYNAAVTEITEYKQKYEELYTEYLKVVVATANQNVLAKKDEENKIFI
jgi:predicted RecB family endonuclease